MEGEEDMNQHDATVNVPKIQTTKVVYPQIYSYTLPDITANEGSQKIGYTERQDVDKRIFEQTNTAAMRLRSEKLWSHSAFFADNKTDFKDTDFHKFLIKSGVENRLDLGTEWFFFNGIPEKSKQLFDNFRQHGFAALQTGDSKIPYELRSEQQDAVDKALEYFHSHEKGEFLWNAKPRFGKTLASYDLAKRLGATKVLIVTNRPAIANSWFDDYEMFVDGYHFISSTSSLAERRSITREQFNAIEATDKKMIAFLSLQDLVGSKYFGGPHDKLAWIANLDWDLLVIDEAHEAVDAERTFEAVKNVKRANTLHLSGTPFKALANQKFASDAIFNWTYLDEQKAKQAELDSEKGTGPHTDLPDLRLYTYRISQMTANDVNEGIEIEGESRDYAFDLNEFFATKNQKFVHEADVKEFLRNLTTNHKYPFSTPELRDELRHTFWYVGNRVDSVKALEQSLKQDEVFKDYKIVLAAGDGKSFEEEEDDFRGNEKSFDKVKKAIAENAKTITLSCGQLTTGVTVKEWSAVLMLTDIKTPSTYMQAAFRAQNPYKFTENGEHKAKQSAYLFDFAPTRVLEIYETFANGLNPKNANGEVTEQERKENVKQLLNFFPVISEDVNGRMVELDAEKVLTFPNALAATEIVQARFMTNLLFNDNIKGVFSFPKEVSDTIESIIDKMPVEKNKRVENTKKELDLDDARKLQDEKQHKINESTGLILGEKIFRANIDRVVDNVMSYDTPSETIDTLADTVMSVAEPLIAKYKETYKQTNAEVEAVKNQLQEKTKLVVAEFENADIKDVDKLKQSLSDIIEHDFVQAQVEQQETKVVENVQKTKEDEIRDRLRSFTRTIPMFIMANASRGEITIDNFDEQISDKDFVDLTNITKEEFHTLRDGFDYTTESGERKNFGGVFERYRFNASIAEFQAEKVAKANYFTNDDDIFELIPNQKNNQIFTPKKVVQMMVDGLEKEQPDLFTRTDSTFIDLYMKSGMYITEIVKKLFINTRYNYSSDAECVKHILEHQVYGLAPTGVLHDITSNYIFGFDTTHDIDTRNFKQHDLLPEAKDGTASEKLTELFGNGGEAMKFDAVVGNPPYQVNDDVTTSRENGAVNSSASPIYHLFVKASSDISRTQSLIMPARWLSGAGKGLREFTQHMINDKHIRSFTLYNNSQDVFPSVDIKGGVCFYVRNVEYTGDTKIFTHSKDGSSSYTGSLNSSNSGVFIPFSELVTIFDKVRGKSDLTNNIQKIISVLKPYGLRTDFFVNQSKYNLPEVYSTRRNDTDIEIIGLDRLKRVIRYAPADYPVPTGKDSIGKWKVFVPYAYGGGALGEVVPTPILGTPILGTPIQICTETFLRYGQWDNKSEAENALKYLKTKIFRVLVGILKTTQHATTTFKLVPLQDFTTSSDIDWSKSIPEIDQQLYRKYGLDQTEIDFIETRVKAME